MTESLRVPRVLKAEMTESSRVPTVLKAEMSGTRRYWYSDDVCKTSVRLYTDDVAGSVVMSGAIAG